MLKVYDCRKNEIFKLQTDEEIFINIDNNFIVLDTQPILTWFGITRYKRVIDIGYYPSIIRTCIKESSQYPFFTCSPVDNKLLTSLEQHFILQKHETSVIGYFNIDNTDLETLIKIRENDKEHREWVIGGATKKIEPPKCKSIWNIAFWDFAHLIKQPTNIGCMFEQEDNQVTILFKVLPKADEIITNLTSK